MNEDTFDYNNPQLQFDSKSRLKHLLSIEGLGEQTIKELLSKASSFFDNKQKIKRTPLLKDKTIVNLFFEPSTRTRVSFEIAAKNLAANVINFNADMSSTNKGESLLDTYKTIQAMQPDVVIVRHSREGASHYIARHCAANICIINAGDGRHAHPTQALLDILTIQIHRPDLTKLSISIVGDIMHSRVARSLISALKTLNIGSIRLIAPEKLQLQDVNYPNIQTYTDIKQGLKDCDVIYTLRLQKERMHDSSIISDEDYFNQYGLTSERIALAKPDAIIMHPGPINRDVEISAKVADGPKSLILEQVTHGVAVRMAVLSMLINNLPE